MNGNRGEVMEGTNRGTGDRRKRITSMPDEPTDGIEQARQVVEHRVEPEPVGVGARLAAGKAAHGDRGNLTKIRLAQRIRPVLGEAPPS